ncbi:MAG: hypothetical protein J7L77_01735 [Clostridiales bacterium]|nr:hypothetical protein [Clostridiales bacterium]
MKILSDTKFMRTLTQMSAALLNETVDFSKPRIGHFTRPFTDQEEYLKSCLILLGEVSIACDQLHYALVYLSGYQSRKTLSGELITRVDYIAYHVENLYLRLGMIPDRSLRLTNEVFRFGLPARECRARTITENRHLKGTPVRARLRAIEKIVMPYREERNIIAHMARYNDPALSKVELFSILQKIEGQPDKPILERTRHFYKRETDAYIEAKRKEFGPIVNDLIDEVARFFETLLPPFRREYAALK